MSYGRVCGLHYNKQKHLMWFCL